MAEHRIEMSSPRHEVGNSDIDFWVWADDKQLGHLHVSRGTIDWYVGKGHVKKYTMTWENFSKFMKGNGVEARAKRAKRKRKNVG